MKKTLLALAIASLIILIPPFAYAGSASWIGPSTSDWTNVSNWSPATIPNGPSDIATFGNVNPISLPLIQSPIELDSLVFAVSCPDFTRSQTAHLLHSAGPASSMTPETAR